MKSKRKDYLALDNLIKQTYFDYIKKHKKLPTQTQVAKILGVSFPTVNKHLRAHTLEDITPQFKQFAPEVIYGLMNRAMKGESKAAKLFFHLVYDWREKITVENQPIDLKDFANEMEKTTTTMKTTK